MTQLKNQVVEMADLIFTDRNPNALGPDLILKRSRISLPANSKMLTFLGVKFVQCEISAERPLRSFLWHSAFLEDCRLSGTFIGNDFGLRTDGYNESGGIVRCDFRDAVLDGCRFFGCDPATISLPKWPCFALLNPRIHFDQMLGLGWPGKLGTWARSYSFSPQNTLVSVEYAPSLIKRYDVTEDDLKKAISRLENLCL